MSSHAPVEDDRARAEVARGPEACYAFIVDLLRELGFPKGVLPPRDLEECGRVRDTGFVWMRACEPYDHVFEPIGVRASYAREVTAYVEGRRMRRIEGVRTRQMMVWVPIAEMSVVEGTDKIRFSAAVGIGASYPFSAFAAEEGKHRDYLEKRGREMSLKERERI